MSKKTWADVKKGDVVELGGREWSVAKIKPKGKKATVVVELKGRRAESIVKLADKVTIAKKGDGTKRGPLYEADGTARRWATKREAAETLGGTGSLPAGDPDVTKPPAKPGADVWDRPIDRVETMLDEILGAKMVGVATDVNVGYYVPPVDVSTIASHLALFHGGIPDAAADDEGKMLAVHTAQHEVAAKGYGPLAVNHWHTKTRPVEPKAAKK